MRIFSNIMSWYVFRTERYLQRQHRFSSTQVATYFEQHGLRRKLFYGYRGRGHHLNYVIERFGIFGVLAVEIVTVRLLELPDVIFEEAMNLIEYSNLFRNRDHINTNQIQWIMELFHI